MFILSLENNYYLSPWYVEIFLYYLYKKSLHESWHKLNHDDI